MDMTKVFDAQEERIEALEEELAAALREIKDREDKIEYYQTIVGSVIDDLKKVIK